MAQIQQGSSQVSQTPTAVFQGSTSNGCRLSPVDTDVFFLQCEVHSTGVWISLKRTSTHYSRVLNILKIFRH